ncbi:MAG: recombinase family protein [Eubacteriales bacterium]
MQYLSYQQIETIAEAVLKDDTEAPRKKRVAAYCRVSTDSEEQMNSYKSQKEYYENKIRANQDWVFAGIYADEGISGITAKKRPQFMQMIADCEAKKVDYILTKSVSRFARNTSEFLEYVRVLKKHGIGIYFEKENLDTLVNTNELFLTMLGAFAQAESESISANITLGIRQSFKLGKVNIMYNNFIGYRRGLNNTPEIIPAEADIIMQIYELFLMGYSIFNIKDIIGKIHTHLKNEPYKLATSTIQRILKNEKYCGDAVLQKTYILDCITKKIITNYGEVPMYLVSYNHPEIVSHDTYNKVQEEFKKRNIYIDKNAYGKNIRKYSTYILSSILYCGNCKSNYQKVTWMHHNSRREVWRCRNRHTNGPVTCPHAPSIDEKLLQRCILQIIKNHLTASPNLKAQYSHKICEAWGYYDKDIGTSSIKNTIKDLSRQMKKLLSTGLENEDQRREFKIVSETISVLSSQINPKYSNNQYKSKKHKIAEVENLIDMYSTGTAEYEDRIIRQLIDKITVLSKEKLQIQFIDGPIIETAIKTL